jgi:hypothetical protein
VLGSDEVGSKWLSKRLYGAGSGGAWSLEVVPLYLWSSKTDCGQASAWSLALNLSEQATKGWSGIPHRYCAVHFILLRWPGIRQDKKSRQRLVNGPASSGSGSGFVNPPPPDAATLES